MHGCVQPVGLSEDDILRADMYGFLARLLLVRPTDRTLQEIAGLSGDRSPIGAEINALADCARSMSAKTVSEEYDGLFIGLGRGELVPYGSYYLTGFLNEKPLAHLRADMRRLGIRRRNDVKEPEDHIGSLMEMMAGLIVGSYGLPATTQTQKAFFDANISSWAGYFFRDLSTADLSRFYRPVGVIGQTFCEIERTAFTMA